MTRRPLSLSLAPLDDESLAGFMLRLAKYTGCSPAVIADRMGLGQYYRAAMPVGSLLTLSSEQLAECAHVARLSHAEMEGLLLAPSLLSSLLVLLMSPRSGRAVVSRLRVDTGEVHHGYSKRFEVK